METVGQQNNDALSCWLSFHQDVRDELIRLRNRQTLLMEGGGSMKKHNAQETSFEESDPRNDNVTGKALLLVKTFTNLLIAETLREVWLKAVDYRPGDLPQNNSPHKKVHIDPLKLILNSFRDLGNLILFANGLTGGQRKEDLQITFRYEDVCQKVVEAGCRVMSSLTSQEDSSSRRKEKSAILQSFLSNWDSAMQRYIIHFVVLDSDDCGKSLLDVATSASSTAQVEDGIALNNREWLSTALKTFLKFCVPASTGKDKNMLSPVHKQRSKQFFKYLLQKLVQQPKEGRSDTFFESIFHPVVISMVIPRWLLPGLLEILLQQKDSVGLDLLENLLAHCGGVWSRKQFVNRAAKPLLASLTHILVLGIETLSKERLSAPTEYGLSCEALITMGMAHHLDQAHSRMYGLLVIQALAKKFDRAFNDELLKDFCDDDVDEDAFENTTTIPSSSSSKPGNSAADAETIINPPSAGSDIDSDSDSSIEGYPLEQSPFDYNGKTLKETGRNYIYKCLESEYTLCFS